MENDKILCYKCATPDPKDFAKMINLEPNKYTCDKCGTKFVVKFTPS
jgi:hypothetical protein